MKIHVPAAAGFVVVQIDTSMDEYERIVDGITDLEKRLGYPVIGVYESGHLEVVPYGQEPEREWWEEPLPRDTTPA